MNRNTRHARESASIGFSLIEVLMVVTVISVIAAFAAPKISSLYSVATRTSQQQNARNIVTMFTAGKDGGLIDWVTKDRNACVADVIAGKAAPASSIFAGKLFQVPNVTGASLSGVYKYIGMDANKNLFFDKSGGQPAN